MDQVHSIVVGAGVVGLAIARELALSGREVLILEASDAIGSETSSRNSEVVHAGLYYAPGSLKAQLCVEGRARLYDYCASRGIAHRRCGKLIVAPTSAHRGQLDRIAERAERAGVWSLRELSGSQARALEPALRVSQALWSPETGIVDSHALMLSLLGEAEAHGAVCVLRSAFRSAQVLSGGGFRIQTVSGAEAFTLHCRELINAAGLHASKVASQVDGLEAGVIPITRYARGHYFALSGRAPFSHLIYPTPDEAHLGVHLTLDLAGQARFGPDVEWVETIDYALDPRRALAFYSEIREYWPALPDDALSPAYSGIRPKIVGPDEAAADFRIDGSAVHRRAGLVNLFGIESPGLTASLAIAQAVRARLDADA